MALGSVHRSRQVERRGEAEGGRGEMVEDGRMEER
jgi:hypothetical protein